MSEIIERSDNAKLEPVCTVRTARGEEFVINADDAVRAIADLLSDYDNEKRMGWTLSDGWISAEIKRLRQRAATPRELAKES